MNIVDYDIIKNANENTLEYLIFLKIEDEQTPDAKLSYKSLNNMIYKINDEFCITDRKSIPLVIRKDLKACEEYLREEYEKNYNVLKNLKLDIG